MFVFFVFLNLRLCLGERGNKNVRCRKLLLSESREGNALPPNYLYRQLSILHTPDCYFLFILQILTHFLSIFTVPDNIKTFFYGQADPKRKWGVNGDGQPDCKKTVFLWLPFSHFKVALRHYSDLMNLLV